MQNRYPPIRPHPENARYFEFRGKPAVLVTSTEHYGAVSNAAFDYVRYLDMLQSYGLNLTRMIVLMREAETEFHGELGWQNTLAPRTEHYIGPWLRSAVPGCRDGGNKFDLSRWNNMYFERLKDFCRKAGERGIAVEVTLFSQNYSGKPNSPWSLTPLNPANNVDGMGAVAYNRYTTCENIRLLELQEALVRKVVSELEGFDNVYYEVCNEPPYPQQEGAVLPDDHPEILGEKAISAWQNRIAEVIREEEDRLGVYHMIAVGDPHESIEFERFSIFNYHYRQWAENGLKRHFSLKKALAFDETLTGLVSWNRELHFDDRRMEAWEFFMRGFSVYDYLDLTIATDDPRGEGNADFPDGCRYDGTVMRRYLKNLKQFMDGLDFIRMEPDGSVVVGVSDTAKAFALVEKGRQYAVYIAGSALKSILLALPEGVYRAQWYNPLTGCVDRVQEGIAGGRDVSLELPLYQTDIALKLTRTDDT